MAAARRLAAPTSARVRGLVAPVVPRPPRQQQDAHVPCPWCWGQRVILVPARNGEGLIRTTCGRCLGVGIR